MQHTIHKNSVGFIPWYEITGGKDQIPREKDLQSVLFYAPAPKTHGNFTVFLLTLYIKKPSDANKRWQQTEGEVDNRKQRWAKITCEGMKRFIWRFIFNANGH